MGIRSDSMTLEIEAEGPTVLIYDEAHRQELQQLDAAGILPEVLSAEAEETVVARLAKRGLLVAYEHRPEDPAMVEVAVGKPLTAAEKKKAPWLPVTQRAFLSLPSGRVVIGGWNGQTAHPAESTRPSSLVEVPPGDYVLTLHRIDWERIDEAGGTRRDLPTEVLILTPTAQNRAPGSSQLQLSFAEAAGLAPWPHLRSWLSRRSIEGETFRGLVVPAGKMSPNVVTNLDRRSVAAMGMRWGARLQIVSGTRFAEAVYLGVMDEGYSASLFEKDGPARWRGSPPELLACLAPWPYDRRHYVSLRPRPGHPPLAAEESGSTVTVRIVADPFFPAPDLSLLEECKVKDGTARARVLLATPKALLLNVGGSILGELRVRPGEALEAEIGGQRRAIHYGLHFRQIEALTEQIRVSSAESAAREAELREKIRKACARREAHLAAGEGSRARESDAARRALERKLRDLRFPPEVMKTAPLRANLFPHFEAPDREVLLVCPIAGDRTWVEATPGATLTLRKSPE